MVGRRLLYDTGAVPLGVRLAVVPFLAGVGFGVWSALTDPKLAPGPRMLAVAACLVVGWGFAGIRRFRTRLWGDPDGSVTWEWQGLVRRWSDTLDRSELHAIRVEQEAGLRGHAQGRVHLVRTDGRSWFVVPCGPHEAPEIGLELAEALDSPLQQAHPAIVDPPAPTPESASDAKNP